MTRYLFIFGKLKKKEIQKTKKKKGRKLAETSERKKKKKKKKKGHLPVSKKKKIRISNFKFQISKIQKKKSGIIV
jgi:hypothetical protein